MIDFRENAIQRLKSFAPHIVGDPLASLVAVKGKPGKAESAGGDPFSGEDGFALDKAFGRLGWGLGSQNTRVWCGVLLASPVAPPPPALTPPPAPALPPALSAGDLRLICEIVDPLAIVALDDEARLALIKAFESTEDGFLADFTPGATTTSLGRQLISVENFEDALANETTKQVAWAQLKRCVPETR
jgi:hypothetical protein